MTTIANRLFSLIEVSGADATGFLQGQLTQDMRSLATTAGLPAAWCNAKGRVIVVLRVIACGADRYGLVVPRPVADSLIKRLTMFRLRARVEIIPTGADWAAAATCAEEDIALLDARGLAPKPGRFAVRSAENLVAFELGGKPRCIELFGDRRALEAVGLRHPLDDSGWRRALVGAGIPHVEAVASERFTAHMLNLDLLGAISFDKGCYSGQEIVARTQHLGQSKRRLFRFRLEADEATPGDRLLREAHEVGEVVSAAGPDLLAVVPLDLSGEALWLDGRRAAPVDLPYAVPGYGPGNVPGDVPGRRPG